VWLEIYIEFWKSDLKTQLGPWWLEARGASPQPYTPKQGQITLQRGPFRENNEAPSIALSRTHTTNTTKKTKCDLCWLLAHNKIVFKKIFCYCFIIFSSLDNDRVSEY